MNILLWIIFGGLAGWIASEFIVTGAEDGIGIIGNVVLGIVGAFVGGWIADQTGIKPGAEGADRPTGVWSFVWAVVGAVLVLLLVNLFLGAL